jgi:hypothetical protein
MASLGEWMPQAWRESIAFETQYSVGERNPDENDQLDQY